jgi:hypothetical protein
MLRLEQVVLEQFLLDIFHPGPALDGSLFAGAERSACQVRLLAARSRLISVALARPDAPDGAVFLDAGPLEF